MRPPTRKLVGAGSSPHIAEVMLGHPSTVESEPLQLLYLFDNPLVEFRDRPIKLGHIGGQKMGAKFHAVSDVDTD
jgi:hypothetical protein